MSAVCSEKCWTPVPCPVHGDFMPPAGRSAPLEMHICCDNCADSTVNPRHLWSIHDSTRWYTDPEGWKAHVSSCDDCRADA
jgi:hypothetical protein